MINLQLWIDFIFEFITTNFYFYSHFHFVSHYLKGNITRELAVLSTQAHFSVRISIATQHLMSFQSFNHNTQNNDTKKNWANGTPIHSFDKIYLAWRVGRASGLRYKESICQLEATYYDIDINIFVHCTSYSSIIYLNPVVSYWIANNLLTLHIST